QGACQLPRRAERGAPGPGGGIRHHPHADARRDGVADVAMIGIVIVSHSVALAEAADQLAHQMVATGAPPVRIASGAGVDAHGAPILGTDAARVAEAIDALAEADVDGVLVLTDLGSAVLSAELALELRGSTVPTRLVAAPFVEGLLAAFVAAAAGAPLETVARESASAHAPKLAQTGDPDPGPGPADAARASVMAPGAVVGRVVPRNRLGLHARPAGELAQAASATAVPLTVRKLPSGAAVPAGSMTRLLALGAVVGDEL